MPRIVLCCALFLALPFVGRSDDAAEPTETLIRLKVDPAASPKPALRYLLLPELREMNPGNAVPEYMKSFMEQQGFFHNKEAWEEREKWALMPLKELPLEKLRGYGSVALRQADYAARMDRADWQSLLRIRSEGVSLLVPEVQQMRQLSWALKVRFRVEIADGRFDQALVTAKTMFALSRHLGDHPTLIGGLVGIAIAHIAVEPLEEMLQQPGCPNLFWALTDLPRPFIDLRLGLQGERMFMMNEFGMLEEKLPMSEEQLQAVVKRFQALFEMALSADSPKAMRQKARDWVTGKAQDQAHVQAARKRLVAYGLDEKAVNRFSALQVVLVDGKWTYEVCRDEAMKAMTLPYWQAEPILTQGQCKDESPFGSLVPAVRKVRFAQARLDQRFALLSVVEALRLHAAEHGKLPAQLADIKVPLPVDPLHGRPFAYTFEAGTVSVKGSSPPGMEKVAVYNVRYEVSLR